MITSTEQSARLFTDTYPDVNEDRVKQLLVDPDFKAKDALYDLQGLLIIREKNGDNVAREKELLKTIFLRVNNFLMEQVKAKGFNDDEIVVATRITEGFLKIE